MTVHCYWARSYALETARTCDGVAIGRGGGGEQMFLTHCPPPPAPCSDCYGLVRPKVERADRPATAARKACGTSHYRRQLWTPVPQPCAAVGPRSDLALPCGIHPSLDHPIPFTSTPRSAPHAVRDLRIGTRSRVRAQRRKAQSRSA
eukprot:6182708-Pleurochrysis_carterae.AAC.6